MAQQLMTLVNNAHSGKCKKQSFFQEENAVFERPMTDQYCSHPKYADRKYYRTLTRSLCLRR
jgi:hypothetical protein